MSCKYAHASLYTKLFVVSEREEERGVLLSAPFMLASCKKIASMNWEARKYGRDTTAVQYVPYCVVRGSSRRLGLHFPISVNDFTACALNIYYTQSMKTRREREV